MSDGAPRDERLARTDRIRVLYIMGAGRSGSTTLGVALGNCPDVFYAGELDAWLRRAAVPNFGGEEREKFWDGVRADVRAAVPDADELFGSAAWRTFEHSTGVARPGRYRRSYRNRYRRVQLELFRAIRARSGRSWTVDSAHFPLRARELRAIPELDVYVILLVRDPSSVVASFSRRAVNQPHKGLLAANVYLWVTHLMSLFVYLSHPTARRRFVRYEEFTADPAGVTHRVLRRSDTGLDARLAALDTGVAFQGNRLLRSPHLELHPAAAGTARRSWLTTVLQAPWTAAFVLLHRRRDARRAIRLSRPANQ